MQGYRYVGASDMASWVHLCSNDLHCIVSRPKKPEASFSTCIAALLHGTVQDTCAIIGSKVLLRSFESYEHATLHLPFFMCLPSRQRGRYKASEAGFDLCSLVQQNWALVARGVVF